MQTLLSWSGSQSSTGRGGWWVTLKPPIVGEGASRLRRFSDPLTIRFKFQIMSHSIYCGIYDELASTSFFLSLPFIIVFGGYFTSKITLISNKTAFCYLLYLTMKCISALSAIRFLVPSLRMFRPEMDEAMTSKLTPSRSDATDFIIIKPAEQGFMYRWQRQKLSFSCLGTRRAAESRNVAVRLQRLILLLLRPWE